MSDKEAYVKARACEGLAIVHVNGVLTHRGYAPEDAAGAQILTGAAANLRDLIQVIREAGYQCKQSQFGLALNRSATGPGAKGWLEMAGAALGAAVGDLKESAFQKVIDSVLAKRGLADENGYDEEALKSAYALIAEGEKHAVWREDISHHIKLYRRLLAGGARRIVLVAHSQGNFFANHAVALLGREAAGRISIVSVANPTARVADGRGRYVTLEEDWVVRGVRYAAVAMSLVPDRRPVEPPLEANRTKTSRSGFASLSEDDPVGHAFSQAYLANDSTREDIVRWIFEDGAADAAATWDRSAAAVERERALAEARRAELEDCPPAPWEDLHAINREWEPLPIAPFAMAGIMMDHVTCRAVGVTVMKTTARRYLGDERAALRLRQVRPAGAKK